MDRVIDLLERDVRLMIIGTVVAIIVSTIAAVAIARWFYGKAFRESRQQFHRLYNYLEGKGTITLEFDNQDYITELRLKPPPAHAQGTAYPPDIRTGNHQPRIRNNCWNWRIAPIGRGGRGQLAPCPDSKSCLTSRTGP